MKGFTLLEVLAVIVIIAILMTIATPIVLNVIESSRKKAFEFSLRNINSSATSECQQAKLNKEQIVKQVIISDNQFASVDKLKFDGEIPDNGFINVDSKCDVALAVYNDKWCAVKEFDGEISFKDFTTALDCNIASVPSSPDMITKMISEGFIPIANLADINNIDEAVPSVFGAGTIYEGTFTGGLDKKYIQVNNITVGSVMPISGDFTGIYDGNNNELIGMTILQPALNGVGLFSSSIKANFKNIKMTNVNIEGSDNVGALSAYSEDTSFDNIYISGTIVGNNSVGGMVGDMYTYEGSHGIINNIEVDVDITGNHTVGGLIGSKYSESNSIYNFNNIKGNVLMIASQASGGIGGYLGKTSISNVDMTVDISKTGGNISAIGGLVGDFDYYPNSSLSNIRVVGSINVNGATVDAVGGLAGLAKVSAGSNIYVDVDVTTNGRLVGGAFGLLGVSGTMSGVTVISNVTGTEDVGGFAGSIDNETSVIEKVSVSGSVVGITSVGGFVGESWANINNCVSLNNVSGNSRVGGFIGKIVKGNLSNSYHSGTINGTSDVGGFIGYTEGTNPFIVTNSYWNTTASSIGTSVGGIGKTDSQLKTAIPDATNFVTWSTEIWNFGTSSQLPILK